MVCATLKDAKAKLNTLVDKAIHGEDVILMRGSRHVAVIMPISDEDIRLDPMLSDAQAERLWARVAEERRAGRLREFGSPEAAVKGLSK